MAVGSYRVTVFVILCIVLMENSPILEMSEILKLCRGNMRPFVEGTEVTTHGVMCIGHTTETKDFADGTEILKVFALQGNISDHRISKRAETLHKCSEGL